ncbi:hypothetical protein GCM10025734_46030 [Kitasatospora paranensis]
MPSGTATSITSGFSASRPDSARPVRSVRSIAALVVMVAIVPLPCPVVPFSRCPNDPAHGGRPAVSPVHETA